MSMHFGRTLVAGLVCVLGLTLGSDATAQMPAGYSQYRDPAVTPTSATTSGYERLTGQNNPAIKFFGASRSQQPVAPVHTLAAPAARAVATAPTAKPYAALNQSSNISPYLNLDARENDLSLPNYYAFVRPQLDQQRFNQMQQLENRRLQQQVRMAAGASIGPSSNGGMPTTGHTTQFMNPSGYYPQR